MFSAKPRIELDIEGERGCMGGAICCDTLRLKDGDEVTETGAAPAIGTALEEVIVNPASRGEGGTDFLSVDIRNGKHACLKPD